METMNYITKSYKFRIYPNESQKILIEKTFGCCRFVYNHYLAKSIEDYERTGKMNSRFQNDKDYTQLKKSEEFSWLKETDASAHQNAIRNLDAAYQNFFRRVKQGQKPGFPKFKSVYTVKLQHKDYKKSREEHFYIANKKLYNNICSSSRLRMKFSSRDIKVISQGDTPNKYTWHHHQDKGKLELVDREIHSKTSHIGGYSIWGGEK